MSWFYNLKIANKLILAFSLVTLLTAFIGYMGIDNMGTINSMLNKLYAQHMLGLSDNKEANINLIYYDRALRNFILDKTQEDRDERLRNMKKYEASIRDYLSKVKQGLETEEGKVTMREIETDLEDYFSQVNQVIEAVNRFGFTNVSEQIIDITKRAREKADIVDNTMTKLSNAKLTLGKKYYDESDVVYKDNKNLLIFMIIISVLAGFGMGILISRMISKPLNMAVNLSDSMAQGDLTKDIDGKLLVQKDEVGMLGRSLQSMIDKLRDVVDNVKSASDNVTQGSQELSTSSEQMSQGATEQAASAEEVSSSMEEMAANIKQNTENSMQTEKIAMKSAMDAEEGGNAVSETVSAMKEIAGRISIIEEIARQTNLLALNAAIEAARAGEHGKGFAVVASEVRKLAERSQTAAGEINLLSTKSVTIAEKAGQMLSLIVPDIKKTAELVQEITASSNEQNSGADQINNAIIQLNQVIQQNASASEEMSSTAEELASQAEQLQQAISFFRTNESGTPKRLTSIKTPAKRADKPIALAKTIVKGKNDAGGFVLNMNTKNISDAEFEKF
ncbi:MAG: methyl-accepting chemotaxis protein [Bacteroidota bacterium]